ncbi:hypothetical protein SNOG_12200 [Parastagonospora nodorum SN15]|uniref:BTB domain-containing protein n=1 Tax=Phaeosphaeria nodorum (strain SN15 / ATCC MYA-4574 / FGSC 10173) TaxID=321614 RepID=Q0U7R4_PHANO|nr:hypothetical protein SNOG_12200 [Parastagonospora nodorum SN15]EAT80612.2 hypothetical protein SNOG_12200 [Parastagonospora nodorum SN15]
MSRAPRDTKLFANLLLSNTKAMGDVQKKLQELSDSYQTLQAELQGAVDARQKLESQQQENTTVKKAMLRLVGQEFDILDDEANIYKQIGPVLLKQDKTEAVMAVNGRLEFIDKEIKRIEQQIKGIQDKAETVKTERYLNDFGLLFMPRSTVILEVHFTGESLLGKSSEFFKRAMKPEWASLREDPDTIDLTDELSGPVLLYVRWLYSGELQVDIPAFRKGGAEENRTASEQAYKKLASAYLFGEMVMDVSFKNAIIPKFIETKTRFKIPTHPYIVDELYSGTTDSSPIRRLLADIIACGCDPREPTWAEYLKAIPHQAVIDSMMALAALQDPLFKPVALAMVGKYLEKDEK